MELKINLSRFRKLAEYKEGQFVMLMPHEKYNQKHYCVYLIVFDDGYLFYVGVSTYLQKRLRTHWYQLRAHTHKLRLLQNAFDNCKTFSVYALNEADKAPFEWDFIKTLRPPLNLQNSKSDKYIFIKNMELSANLLGVSLHLLLQENRKIKFYNMNIKKVIQRKGFTLASVAKQMKAPTKEGEEQKYGISLSAISQIVGGKNPSVGKLQEIADIIGVSLSELVADEASEKETYIICPHCGEKIKISVSK